MAIATSNLSISTQRDLKLNNHFHTKAYLVGIQKALLFLNNLSPIPSPLISSPKLQCQQRNNQNNQRISNQTSQNPRNIIRSILSSKHSCTNNTTNSASTNKCRRSQGAFPLSTNIVGLVCYQGGTISVA